LMVEARPVDGVLYAHSEVEHVDDHFEHTVDDRRSAGRAERKYGLAILQYDGRRHRGKRRFARRDRVGFAWNQSVHVGHAWLGGEIAHLFVEQKAEPRRGDFAAVSAVQRIGDADDVALLVGDGVVRGLVGFLAAEVRGLDFTRGRRLHRVDRGAAL